MGKGDWLRRALCAGAVSCWKTTKSLEIWRTVDRSCSNSITNLDSVIGRHQTGFNVNRLWLADWCHQWLNVNCVRRRFCRDVFLLDWWMCVQSVILWAFGVVTVDNVFVSEQNDAYITVLNGSAVHSDFWAQTFHKAVYCAAFVV